ncbi:MAG: Gfo/Idh/MocA family oxidoreductase, partial [Gemmatimonadota bacterium]
MTPLDRRDFVKAGAGTALGMSLAPGALLGRDRGVPADKLRLGFIGVGGRGSWLLGLAARRDDTEIKAVCDIVPEKARRAADAVTEAGGNEPRQFTSGEEDYLNLIEMDDIDAVIIATPWLWHTPMAIAAMERGKAVGVEVPAATPVQDCWDLVQTQERTGMPFMMMENVCYRRDVMAVLRIVREGLL